MRHGINLTNSLIFADSAKAKFGTGGDLEIFIMEVMVDLLVPTLFVFRTPLFNIQNNAGNENIALFYDDADLELWNGGSVKLATTPLVRDCCW